MKPRKLFSILFPTYLIISLLGLIVLLFITRFAFRNFYFNETKTTLSQKAHLIAPRLTKVLLLKKRTNLKEVVSELAKKSENRITLISLNGDVIADSHFNFEKMENHIKRVEIKHALNGDDYETIRFSKTLNEEHLYLAIALREDAKIVAVLRLSVSIKELQKSLSILTKKIILWSLVLFILLTYIIAIQSKKISTPLEEITKQVDEFAAGDFKNIISFKMATSLEVTSLFSAIEAMSKKIQTQFIKINKQKNEQSAVFASMIEGVITIYPDMNIYHINIAALNLFNFTSDKTIKGTPLKDVVRSERIYKMASQLLLDKKTIDNEFEYESGLILNVHGTLLNSKDGSVIGAVFVFNDITKVRELENHRKQFVANVSHELKTPLTAIQGYLETILEEENMNGETLRKFLRIISKHSTRLKSIIEDLLALSSIEKESEVGHLELVEQDIWQTINFAIDLCQTRASMKNITIRSKGMRVLVKINSPLIEQAIINLLDNAIKYGPENSSIDIITKVINSKLEIMVIDYGTGIPKEHQERVFERFYSINKARSRELGGSGLGLSIVKHIALSHNGNVRVESHNGKGSIFILELPLS